MALNNLSNEKLIQILLIVSLSLSSYGTLTNTQLDGSIDSISSKLDEKLDAIIRLRVELTDKLDKALTLINSKVESNSVEIKIIDNRLNSVEDTINTMEDKLDYMNERLVKVESKIP
jgi:uncharacterized protein Yka (UPF0111/DUF47 family)